MSDPKDIERLLVNRHMVDPDVARDIRDRLEMAVRTEDQVTELFELVQELKKKLGIDKPPERPETGVRTESSIEWTE